MNRLLLIVLVALSGLLAVPAAAAGPDESAGLKVAAAAAPFCRLSADFPASVQLIDGRAELGSVRELCNTSAGYEVRADFTNLSGGTVTAGSDSAALDRLGRASFRHTEARHQRRAWRLSKAVVRDGGPVVVRLSIAPL